MRDYRIQLPSGRFYGNAWFEYTEATELAMELAEDNNLTIKVVRPITTFEEVAVYTPEMVKLYRR